MKRNPKRKQYARLRGDSGQHRRILAVMVILGMAAFVPVALQLYNLMIRNYAYYSKLALRNQTRTTTVTADRGTIYDRNMNILACSKSVENVYLDPHELKQSKANLEEISERLAEILELDPADILKKAKDTAKISTAAPSTQSPAMPQPLIAFLSARPGGSRTGTPSARPARQRGRPRNSGSRSCQAR